MKKIIVLNSLVVLALMMCTGCASIVSLIVSGGVKEKVRIDSNPPGARVVVTDGEMTITTNTPAVLRLVRQTGYFKGEHYTVKFDLDGYYPSEVELNSQIGGWYWANIAFGGIPGFFIVDPLTGAMWNLTPAEIHRNLISTSENLTPEQLRESDERANMPSNRESSKREPSRQTGKNSTQ